MAILKVTIAPAAGVSVPAGAGPFLVDAVFARALPAASGATRDFPTAIQDTVRASLDSQLRGVLVLSDPQPSSSIEFAFLAGSGATRLKKTASVGTSDSLSVALSAADVAIIAAADPQPAPPPPQAYRQAYFVQVSDTPVAFEAYKLQIASVKIGDGGWTRLGLDKVFHADNPRTTSVSWLPEFLNLNSTTTWTAFHVAVDGQFTFSVPADSGDAWIWWLSGPSPAIGIVLDTLSVPRVARIAVALPPTAAPPTSAEAPIGVPPVFNESEVANNPHIYTEDPGSFCQPFKNPERVLGERSFFVIFRAEQPVISAEASVRKDPLGVLTSAVTPPSRGVEMTRPAATPRGRRTAAASAAATTISSGALIAGSTESSFVRHTLPSKYLDLLQSFDRGRTEMDAKHPVQWESDTSRYQAATVARGHIIEIRMRWRSNGYSLGTVAKTLTLAPRQAKRIEKIEWRRSEISRRQESTQLADQISDSVNQERAYDDSVSANLSEWERGKSSSTMLSHAGGMGFVYAGFIAGGGHGASYASSSSSQEGGRATSASEEQRLRDSIRRYGESLRKLDSLVVNEISQEESVTGTTEVVRNANYGHSLTVIYYQILRHLKIETGVAGVRECLFVPFAISPFTVARAYRWRESIGNALRDAQYAGAIKYLKDVLTNFTNSNVPAGRRSDQPVRFIHGSVFVRIAIDRPHNKDDGGFDVTKWLPLQPFLLTPALGIFSMLNGVSETERDALFQRQHAPGIAANWVNTLLMKVGSVVVPADFTLATRYQFNGTVRVDFTAVIPASTPITRETLSSIQFKATKPLPPGSVANLQSLSYTYQTDHFQRSVAVSEGSEDLILPETGVIDSGGAVLSCFPDEWERDDIRSEMILAVQSLVEHLNEHVEYYHKAIWWGMDRDRLFMLIDGFYAPGTNQVSIASVVERDPIAIIGNAIVYRVSNGAFLGLGSIKTPADLYNYYVAKQNPTEPMLISLPTDGLYAQTVMDDCSALEEHYGNTDWVLNDPDLSLGEIAPELLASRRAEPQGTTPTQFPQTLINLQNAPAMPAPSGLAGALSAVGNPNAFRDMAGLAGTQANAAAAFQAAADLAKNFGNQAAALKLAELAKDAHSTQTADQKLATVQRAADKQLITPEAAQTHASQILDSLHAPTNATPEQQRDAAVTHAVFAASNSGQPFTVTHTDGIGNTTVAQAAPGGGTGTSAAATPAGPTNLPAALQNRILGFDMDATTGGTLRLSDFVALKNLGKRFGIHKLGQFRVDSPLTFHRNYAWIREAGMIRGAYDFFSSVPVATHVQWIVDHVKRLGPGDLAPAIDLEDGSGDLDRKYHFKTLPDPGRLDLFLDIQRWLDDVETKLGRTPIVYTGVLWREQFHPTKLPDAADMNRYPLWTAHPQPTDAPQNPQVEVFPSWRDYAIWQYAEDTRGKKAKNDKAKAAAAAAGLPAPTNLEPSQRWGSDPYVERGTEMFDGIDYDALRGSIYDLRGLADLGHTSPHLVGNQECIAYTEADGSIHLLELVNGAWQDENISSSVSGAVRAGGDPAAIGLGQQQTIAYRGIDDQIHVLKRTIGDDNWQVTNILGRVVDDPAVAVFNNTVHILCWDDSDRQRHLTQSVNGFVPVLLNGTASGCGAFFVHNNALSAVSRIGTAGELFDLIANANLTGQAHDSENNRSPAATYRPATYTKGGSARIVYRALRGDIWQIELDTMNATNVSVSAGHAPPSAGSPTVVLADTTHIFFRTSNGTIIQMFDDSGVWRRRNVCVSAAADPTAYITAAGKLAVAFSASSGSIRVATLNDATWTCVDTIPVPDPVLPPLPDGGIPV